MPHFPLCFFKVTWAPIQGTEEPRCALRQLKLKPSTHQNNNRAPVRQVRCSRVPRVTITGSKTKICIRNSFSRKHACPRRARQPPCSASTTTRSRGKELTSAPLPCLPCFCSVSYATLLCLTPVMGCAHMDDHRACRVTSVQTLSTTTKKTENNKCSAVAMWMVTQTVRAARP